MHAPTGLITDPTRVLFFTGKGGMGKTTLACAQAVALTRAGRRVLLVSTDPASNLDEVLETPLGEEPRPVTGAPGLDAANVDPEQAAAAYRERAVGPYRGVLPDSAIASMEESLSGACTVEIAAFDVFARLLGDPQATAGYDHVLFDTPRPATPCACCSSPPPGRTSWTPTPPAPPASAPSPASAISATSTPPASARSPTRS